MNAPTLSVIPVFATPLAVIDLPIATEVNQSCTQLLRQHAAAHPEGGPGTDPLCYRSRDDLLEWHTPPVAQICAEILRGVWSTIVAVNTFSAEQLKSLSMQARGAFTIVRPNGHVPATAHPLTSWCGIYCTEAPEPSPERADSGLIRLYESRLVTVFADATNSAMRVPFTPGHYSWRAAQGKLLVFPGSITHEVPLIRATTPLTFLSVRCRFVGTGQEGWSRW